MTDEVIQQIRINLHIKIVLISQMALIIHKQNLVNQIFNKHNNSSRNNNSSNKTTATARQQKNGNNKTTATRQQNKRQRQNNNKTEKTTTTKQEQQKQQQQENTSSDQKTNIGFLRKRTCFFQENNTNSRIMTSIMTPGITVMTHVTMTMTSRRSN